MGNLRNLYFLVENSIPRSDFYSWDLRLFLSDSNAILYIPVLIFQKTIFSVNFCKLVFVTYMFPIEITLHFRNFQVFQYAWQYLLFRTWVNGYFSCWVEFWKLDTKMPKCQNSFLVRDLLNIIDRLWLLQ